MPVKERLKAAEAAHDIEPGQPLQPETCIDNEETPRVRDTALIAVGIGLDPTSTQRVLGRRDPCQGGGRGEQLAPATLSCNCN